MSTSRARHGRHREAPVLGSIPNAAAGTLLVFAGGDPALFARLRPLLAELGPAPQLVGAVGRRRRSRSRSTR
jgi:3-hydroxyisobutyrate dehydrogenase